MNENERETVRDALEELVANIEMRSNTFGLNAIVDTKTFLDAKSALSVPSRNCDRFVDELDAQLAFLNEVWLISVDRDTMLERDKYENWSDEMRTRYGRWLLAHVTERKGETNGSK